MLAVGRAVAVGLIVLNGFIAMSELVFVSAKQSVLERMARGGSRGVGVALELTRKPGRMLAAVQIGMALLGIVAGAFGGLSSRNAWIPCWKGRACDPRRRASGFPRRDRGNPPSLGVLGELVPMQVGLLNSKRAADRVVDLLDWS